MSVNYDPTMKTYSGQGAFRFWCQKVLPLVYDDSLSYYELLNKVVDYLNNTISDVANMEDNVSALLTAYEQLQDYVNDYFDNLDVQEEINNKLDEMVLDGTFYNLFKDTIDSTTNDAVLAWLDENITGIGNTVLLDRSLTLDSAAAPADLVGDLKSALKETLYIDIIDWTEDAYIKTNYSVGDTVSLTPLTLTGYRCAIVNCEQGDRFLVNAVGKSTPRAWAFLDIDNKLLSVSPTMTTLTDYLLITPINAKKLILNDAPPNGVFDTISLKGRIAATDILALENNVSNSNNTFSGGVNNPYFEQGSASIVNNLLTPTNSSNIVRTYNLQPLLLKRNTNINIANGYLLYVIQVKQSVNGYLRVQNTTNGYVSGNVVIPNNGLFIFFVKKEDNSSIIPSEAMPSITIERTDEDSKTIDMILPKNPYKNIVWDNVSDIVSASHAHCTTQEQFNTLKAKYDHVAISNYHPSIPYYPLSNYFTGTDGILASPNAEHFAFDDVSSNIHMNSVGGILASEDSGFNGTIFDAIEEGYNSLIVRNGGGMTLNHPNWSGLSASEVENIISFGGFFAIEIWNATCEQLTGTGYSLAIWDSILSKGKQIFGTCVPDHEAQYHPNEDRQPFGYNHMLTVNGTEEEILNAYRTGKFYGTLYNDGLTLENYGLSSGQIDIEVSEASTFLFKTATRSVSIDTPATTATFEVTDSDIYVRCEVTRGSNKLFTNAIIL